MGGQIHEQLSHLSHVCLYVCQNGSLEGTEATLVLLSSILQQVLVSMEPSVWLLMLHSTQLVAAQGWQG